MSRGRPAILTRPALHTAAAYVMVFATTGAYIPFWPLWLADWGLAPEEIGLYTALAVAVRVVAGLAIPALSDRLDARRATLAVSSAVVLLLFVAHLAIETRPMLLAATLAVGVAMAGIGPIAEALGVAAARAWDFPYAQARGFGSLGYLGANLAIGVLIARTAPRRCRVKVPRQSRNSVSTATEKAQSAPIIGSLIPSARQWIEP